VFLYAMVELSFQNQDTREASNHGSGEINILLSLLPGLLGTIDWKNRFSRAVLNSRRSEALDISGIPAMTSCSQASMSSSLQRGLYCTGRGSAVMIL
jgi:hypothetical protein